MEMTKIQKPKPKAEIQQYLTTAAKDKNMVCPECGCKFKDKYMIRVDHDWENPHAKRHFASTTRRSIVGWIKLICNEFGNFEDITIHNLTKQCAYHKEYWQQKDNRGG